MPVQGDELDPDSLGPERRHQQKLSAGDVDPDALERAAARRAERPTQLVDGVAIRQQPLDLGG